MALTKLTDIRKSLSAEVNNLKVSGITTFTGSVSIGGTLTYQDVTNVDSVGIITAQAGINVSGGQLDVGSNIKIGNAGVITATSFVGSGANLTSLPAQATIANNADNRVITGGSGVNLNGESTLTYNGNGTLNILGASGNTQLALFRTNTNTTGTAGIVGFYASDNHVVASMFALGDGDNEGAHLVFNTTSAASGTNPYSNVTERLRIDSGGRVLINTTNTSNGHISASNLAVQGGDLSIFKDSGGDNTGVSGHKLKFVTQSGSLGEIDVLSEGAGGPSGRGGSMRFYTKTNNTASAAERLRITSTGELGVNTTAPVEKLGISGNMRFVNPNGNTSRITALPSGTYNTGVSGGSAICFQRIADGGGGSDEIFFETHWQGNRHGESMRINKYGHVIKPNQPSFNVTIGGGQINSNVGVIVFTDTTSLANHNTGNHYNTSNGRFTAPVAGRYQINARMLTNSSTQSYTIYLLRVNANNHGYIGHNHSDFWFMESGSWVLNLNANDYVDCFLQVHSGHGGFNYASFSGFLIG